jgi:effector-binding domain-containing protein
MITIIAITLVLAISLITALVSKFTIITKLEKKVDGLEKEFHDSYQAYNEFQQIYSRLAGNYESAYKLYSQSYKDIRETYTRLMNLLQEYTSCLPDNIRAELKKIEDRERQLKQLQNQILKDIENNPNYDDITKQNLKEQVLNREI